MNAELKRFLISTPATSVEGGQVWWVDAATEEDALAAYHQNGGQFYTSEIDVVGLGEPEIHGQTTLGDCGDSAQHAPEQLKPGECWPEHVMQQWDYWRAEIANGFTGSAPRDWFESLAEMQLIPPAQQQPLANELLEALRDMLEGWRYIRHSHGDLYGVGWDRAQEKAERAIAKATGGAT